MRIDKDWILQGWPAGKNFTLFTFFLYGEIVTGESFGDNVKDTYWREKRIRNAHHGF